MPHADGMSFLPLLTGRKTQLNRCFVYMENLHPKTNSVGVRPAWYGLETTRKCFDTHWSYTEYASGERELYNLDQDPHRLENLAGRPAFAGKVDQLHRLLHREVITPNGVKFKSS